MMTRLVVSSAFLNNLSFTRFGITLEELLNHWVIYWPWWDIEMTISMKQFPWVYPKAVQELTVGSLFLKMLSVSKWDITLKYIWFPVKPQTNLPFFHFNHQITHSSSIPAPRLLPQHVYLKSLTTSSDWETMDTGQPWAWLEVGDMFVHSPITYIFSIFPPYHTTQGLMNQYIFILIPINPSHWSLNYVKMQMADKSSAIINSKSISYI